MTLRDVGGTLFFPGSGGCSGPRWAAEDRCDELWQQVPSSVSRLLLGVLEAHGKFKFTNLCGALGTGPVFRACSGPCLLVSPHPVGMTKAIGSR